VVICLSGAESTQKIIANSTYWEAKLKGAGGVARSRGKEHLFYGKDWETFRWQQTWISLFFRTPLHEKNPEVFDQTGGWR